VTTPPPLAPVSERASDPASADARPAILALFLLGLLVLCLENVAPLALVAVSTTLALLLAPAARGWRLRVLLLIASFTWSTAVSQGLFYAAWPRTPLVSFGPFTVWEEGITHGLQQSLRFMAMLSAGLGLSLRVSTDRLVVALRRLGLPYGLTLMAAAVVRFVPLVGGEWVDVRAARAARGRPTWARGPWAWLRLELSLLRPVLARSLRRARSLAESLEIRGFDPLAERAPGLDAPMPMGARVGLVALTAVVLAAVFARLTYTAYGAELWYDPALRPLYAFVRAWM